MVHVMTLSLNPNLNTLNPTISHKYKEKLCFFSAIAAPLLSPYLQQSASNIYREQNHQMSAKVHARKSMSASLFLQESYKDIAFHFFSFLLSTNPIYNYKCNSLQLN